MTLLAHSGRAEQASRSQTRTLLEDWMQLLPYLLLVAPLALSIGSAGAGPQIESVYTELSDAGCEPPRIDDETGSSAQRCAGVGGYELVRLNDDSRTSVNLVSPAGEEHALNYWNVVTRAFSSLGPRAEWRVIGRGREIVPVALIVRVNSYSDADADQPVINSYLSVAKITNSEICVTDVIEAGAEANERARKAADAAAGKPCIAP
jgi:hypothetical protein